MKKFLLVLAIFIFAAAEANATTAYVKFNNAGSPVTVTRGFNAPISVRSPAGSNYASPARTVAPIRTVIPYGYRSRYAYIPPMPYYNYPAPIHTAEAPQPSRLDSNTAPNIPTKSYTMNGVTYYN